MAIAFVLDFTGDGDMKAKYDGVNATMGVVKNPPDGLIFHWASVEGNALRVVDVWESKEKFDHFMHSLLGPALAKHQFPEPKLSWHEVYNTITKVPALT